MPPSESMETADHKPRAKGIPYESDYWLGGMRRSDVSTDGAAALAFGQRT
jgi:hypothetical protein